MERLSTQIQKRFRHYDVLATEQDAQGKTRFNKIGVLVPTMKKDSFSLKLHFLNNWFVVKAAIKPEDKNPKNIPF